MTLDDYLRQQGYPLQDPAYTALVDKWQQWYHGKVDDFHLYTIFNGHDHCLQERAQMNAAKMGAEYWAGLLWNNESSITINGGAQEDVERVLAYNAFNNRMQELLERSFALGSGAVVIYPTDDYPVLEYVSAKHIYPLAWEGDDCTGCAFAGIQSRTSSTYTLKLMMIEQQDSGGYRIRNKFFVLDQSNNITETPTPPGVLEEYTTNTKRFALVKPNIANNSVYRGVKGLSVYANAIDILKSIDLAFDGINVSMQIGRPRVAVAIDVASTRIDPTTGDYKQVFDSRDIAFYQIPGADDGQPIIKDITTTYRAGEFEQSLQTALTMYSRALGLGDRAFKWDAGSLATATQVISENNDLQRSMEKHQELLRPAIVIVCRAILDILGHDPNADIEVKFDDAAVRDVAAERQRFWGYVVAGRFPFWRYLMDFEGYSEEDARAMEAEASATASLDASVFGGE